MPSSLHVDSCLPTYVPLGVCSGDTMAAFKLGLTATLCAEQGEFWHVYHGTAKGMQAILKFHAKNVLHTKSLWKKQMLIMSQLLAKMPRDIFWTLAVLGEVMPCPHLPSHNFPPCI